MPTVILLGRNLWMQHHAYTKPRDHQNLRNAWGGSHPTYCQVNGGGKEGGPAQGIRSPVDGDEHLLRSVRGYRPQKAGQLVLFGDAEASAHLALEFVELGKQLLDGRESCRG